MEGCGSNVNYVANKTNLTVLTRINHTTGQLPPPVKDELTSEGISIWSPPQKKIKEITILNFSVNLLRIVILFLFFEDGSKLKILSEIKLPLRIGHRACVRNLKRWVPNVQIFRGRRLGVLK